MGNLDDRRPITLVDSFMERIGGAQRVIVAVAGDLAERGFQVDLITGRIDTIWKKQLSNYGPNVLLKQIRSAVGPLFWLTLPVYIREVNKRVNPASSIVIANSFPATLISLNARKHLGIPSLWYCHSTNDPPIVLKENLVASLPLVNRAYLQLLSMVYSKADRKAVHNLNKIVANSYYVRERLSAVYGLKKSQIDVIYPGVNVAHFAKTNRAPAFLKEVRRATQYLLFCPNGTLFHKNSYNLLLALTKIRKYNYKAIFTGGGITEISFFKRNVRRFHLDGKVLWLPVIDEQYLRAVYSLSEVVIYVPINEPFGLVPLEALLCETPVVASTVGGAAETVEHGRTGLKASPYDPSEISHAIETLLLDRPKAAEMGRLGRQTVIERFNIKRTTTQIIDLIARLNQEI